jgi:hypothetical protein
MISNEFAAHNFIKRLVSLVRASAAALHERKRRNLRQSIEFDKKRSRLDIGAQVPNVLLV